MSQRKKMKRAITAIMAIAMLAGCSKPEAPAATGSKEPSLGSEPIKLSLFMRVSYPDDSVKKYIIDPVQKKFPNVTIDIVKNEKGTNVNDLIAAGTFPDLIFLSTPYVSELKKLDLLEDLSSLVKKYNVDMSRFYPEAVDAIKKQAAGPQLYALPFSMNYAVTYYNKDIFDKFGVPYPKDDMTWDDYLELSRKLTRVSEGVPFSGVDPYALRGGAPMALDYVDPKTGKPVLTSDGWVKAFQVIQSFNSIPGNKHDSKFRDLFIKDRTLATYITYDNTQNFEQLEKDGNPMNWDMVSFPTFKNTPGVGHGIDSHNIAVTSTGKNKDAAFQVLAYLTSKEVQMELSRNGKQPGIQDPEMQKVFGSNVSILKGKNIGAIFKTKAAPMRNISDFDAVVQKELYKAYDMLVSGNSDINTLLRTANEEAEKAIQLEKAK
ncbi:ABC transporter substrate-binding protein [Paenibacillus allorhizosphaerae]|uniref:Extracellular solute-binding protein n=1 Tax=Paenibacillus allorhizosphaerae TaxID=2849866 RepID=A0ABN7TM72_9BACL|nr:ABC transporter substrate-binding protein [Paenibacillus allorhizosphaerae]CAG7639427.1 hypothetical protein PAECIP111802_02543 [Paenibacillus allorhizosphaerae]